MSKTVLGSFSVSILLHGTIFILVAVTEFFFKSEPAQEKKMVVFFSLKAVPMKSCTKPPADFSGIQERGATVPGVEKTSRVHETAKTSSEPVPSPETMAEREPSVRDTSAPPEEGRHHTEVTPDSTVEETVFNDPVADDSPPGVEERTRRNAAGRNTVMPAGSGTGNGIAPSVHPGFQYLRKIIAEKIAYPFFARELNQQGHLFVSFLIREDGNVADVKIVKSSGYALLDRNAVATVKKSAPFPKPPYSTEIVVPVAYSLQ